jgi:hypothetical protein
MSDHDALGESFCEMLDWVSLAERPEWGRRRVPAEIRSRYGVTPAAFSLDECAPAIEAS